MFFVAVSTNTKDVTPFINDEFDRVDELRAAGVILSGWVKADFSGAVLILEGPDIDTVTAALDSLPTSQHDATRIEVTPLVDLDAARTGL